MPRIQKWMLCILLVFFFSLIGCSQAMTMEAHLQETTPPVLHFSIANQTLYEGEQAVIDLEYTGQSSLSFSVSDPNVAVVHSNTLWAFQKGNVVVTVTDGVLSSSVQVEVLREHEIKEEALSLTLGNLRHLDPDTDEQIDWEVDAPEVLSLTSDAVIAAIGEGYATVTGTTDDITFLYHVTVVPEFTEGSFYLEDSLPAIPVGSSVSVPLVYSETESVSWISSNEEIATVENGVISAVSAGVCKISVSSKDTDFAFPIACSLSDADIETPPFGHHAFVYDVTNDYLVYSHGDLYDTIFPASTTKLFTAYVALQYLDEDQIIIPNNEVCFITSDSSTAGILIGYSISVKELTAALIIPSGNDAAYAMAAAAGRIAADDPDLDDWDAVAAFMDEMGRQAEVLGLSGTHFIVPDGYPSEDHYTCLRDMIEISKLAYDIPLVRWAGQQISYSPEYEGYAGNWNTYVWMMKEDNPYYDPHITGLKTGTSTPSGFCLIATAEYDDHAYIIGTFGAETGDDRFQDILNLMHSCIPEAAQN